jgi:hypothetical protein
VRQSKNLTNGAWHRLLSKRGEEKEEKDENKTRDVHTHSARPAIGSKTNLIKSNSKGDKK